MINAAEHPVHLGRPKRPAGAFHNQENHRRIWIAIPIIPVQHSEGDGSYGSETYTAPLVGKAGLKTLRKDFKRFGKGHLPLINSGYLC